MKMQDIREMAAKLGLKPGKLAKLELIRTIQRQEGNTDCFGSAAADSCGQLGCLWREDCLGAKKAVAS